MENTTDSLQVKIIEARANLSKETREAIDNINWKLIVLGMSKKYNPDQLDSLETETELLLCGILNPDSYAAELENRMMLTKEEVGLLLGEMDKLIFKQIQKELEKKLDQKEKTNTENKPLVFDSRFSSMPKDVQEAIAHSNWKENLYKIAQKYKLSIIQMGDLEDITVKVISNVIHPDKYENEIAFKIIIPKNDVTNLVSDVNKDILMEIRKSLKEEWGDKTITNDQLPITNEVPLPPYAKVITNEKLLINNLEEKSTEVVRNVEISKQTEPIINKIEEIKPIEVIKNIETPKMVEKPEEIQIPKPTMPFVSANSAQKELENIIKTIPFPTKKDLPAVPAHAGEDKKIIEQVKIIPQIKETPDAPKNIMDEKLKGATVSNNKVTDYSIPKINTPSSNSSDPYREVI